MPIVSGSAPGGGGVVTSLTSVDSSIAIGGTAFIPDLSVNFPLQQIGPGLTTNPIAITAVTEGTADAVVSTGAGTFTPGNDVLITFVCAGITPGANSIVTLVFLRDAVVLGQAQATPAVGVGSGALSVTVRDTPAAGNHTFAVTAFLSVGNNQATINGGLGGSGNLIPIALFVSNWA